MSKTEWSGYQSPDLEPEDDEEKTRTVTIREAYEAWIEAEVRVAEATYAKLLKAHEEGDEQTILDWNAEAQAEEDEDEELDWELAGSDMESSELSAILIEDECGLRKAIWETQLIPPLPAVEVEECMPGMHDFAATGRRTGGDEIIVCTKCGASDLMPEPPAGAEQSGYTCLDCGRHFEIGRGYQLRGDNEDGDLSQTRGPLCPECIVGQYAEANQGGLQCTAIIEDYGTEPKKQTEDEVEYYTDGEGFEVWTG